MVKNEFESRKTLILIGFVWNIRILMHGTKSMIIQFNTRVKILKLPIETLMQELKHLVAEKHEFEYRDETILIARFDKFGQSGF